MNYEVTIFARGSWQVAPPKGSRTSYRRTSLARWIVDSKQGAGHLLARVIVNRLWQHHHGRGIVETPNDFGRQGTHYGETDEIGNRAAVNRVSVNDLRATILHLLGMDHKRLTYRYSGRDFRLTDVAGEVVKAILA